MELKERVLKVLDLLEEHYGPTKCYLNHENAWQLLIATILSAQCTDDRVNMVTKDLFKKYTSIKDFAEASQSELEKDIHSTGFFRNKAANIIACCQMLLTEYGGEVPDDIDKLTKLPGVGRKTANVVRGKRIRHTQRCCGYPCEKGIEYAWIYRQPGPGENRI